MSPANLLDYYKKAESALGPQGWWPAKSVLEVCVGAILTQNTNWKNVEKAIQSLESAGAMSIQHLYELPPETLATLIRPAGYHQVKSKRLKNLMRVIVEEYDGDLDRFFEGSVSQVRERVLSINGIGPETADAIVLYAARKLSFVVDTYTKRIFVRHGVFLDDATYDDLRDHFMRHLPDDLGVWSEFHALIDTIGKHWCRPAAPLCELCPWKEFL